MSAGTYNTIIEQGSNWGLTLTKKVGGVVADLTGFSARCQVRDRLTGGGFVLTATCTIPTPADGTVNALLTPAQTETIPDLTKILYYNVEVYTAGDVTVERLVEGVLAVKLGATRS